MTKVSIINESIKDIDFLKNKLEERDSEVTVLKNLEELKDSNASTLICHSTFLNKNELDSKNLLSLARNLKIKKIILIEAYSNFFKVVCW